MIRKAVLENLPELCSHILAGEKLSSDDCEAILEAARNAVHPEGRG